MTILDESGYRGGPDTLPLAYKQMNTLLDHVSLHVMEERGKRTDFFSNETIVSANTLWVSGAIYFMVD